ncbi:MAG: hypothetical protein LBR65_06070 [Culturomica sp.]|jgi:hypothetical protein|nr:hypothetical protein [Culturomica sp.]
MTALYCFNPDCEMAVADGSPYYTPPANIRRMSEELAYLPVWMGGGEEAVLVSELPDPAFLQMNRELFGVDPQLALWEAYCPDPAFRPVPWGWSPRMDYLFQTACWKEEYRELMSRLTARACLERVYRLGGERLPGLLPEVCRTLEAVRQAACRGAVVVKAPWSSSGKGVLRAGPGVLLGKEAEWVSGILRRQGYVMVEKRLDKVCDLAGEFVLEDGRCRFVAWSLFTTGSRGEYKGNFLGRQSRIEEYLSRYAELSVWAELKERVADALRVLIASRYEGVLGVDMMVYKDDKGKYNIQPCVEINLRHTMGYLAHRFSDRFVAEQSSGRFTLDFFAGEGEALQRHRQNSREFPLKVVSGKIVSGYHALTPVNKNTGFMASVRLVAGEGSMHDFEDQFS